MGLGQNILGIMGVSLLLTSASCATRAATYYVATTGSDSNPGTQAAPFKTILKGSKVLASGDTLLIRGGTYTERMVNGINGFRFVNGSPGAYTRYAAAPGDERKVIISPGPAEYDNFTVFFGKNSYIEMSGLVFDNSRMPDTDRYLVKFADDGHGNSIPHHILFKNNELRNARMGISNGGGNKIIGNYFHDLTGYGIYTLGDNGLLEANTFQNIGGYAIHHFQQHYTVNNWIIRNNVILKSGKTYHSPTWGKRACPGCARPLPAVVISRGTGTQFYNNIIYDSYAGLQVGLSAEETLIANNTVYGNGLFGINIGDKWGSSRNARVLNNISYGNDGSQINDEGKNTILQNNLTIDPQFMNPAAGDFGVQAGSRAIDKGMTLAEVKTDFTGKARPEGAAYDIGAFEGAGSKADVLPGIGGGLPPGSGGQISLPPLLAPFNVADHRLAALAHVNVLNKDPLIPVLPKFPLVCRVPADTRGGSERWP